MNGCVYICIYIHLHLFIYIYTSIHIYIYTHTYVTSELDLRGQLHDLAALTPTRMTQWIASGVGHNR